MSSGSDLLACKLCPGQKVRVGRKAGLELTVNRRYLSSLHCQINLPNEKDACCRVCDYSHNGTWLLPAGRVDLNEAVKLTKGEPQDVAHGDTVLLVSPQHVHCRELLFTLQRGQEEGEFILQQLSSSYDFSQKLSVKRRQSESPPANKVAKLNSEAINSPLLNEKDAVTPPTLLTTELESCPHCIKLLPIDDLPAHVDLCPLAHPSVDQCPLCSGVYPVTELVAHVDTCSGERKIEEEVKLLEPCTESTSNGAIGQAANVISPDTEIDGAVKSKAVELNKTTSESEHCQHCLGLFPLDELIDHALSCSHRKKPHSEKSGEGSQGEPMERCMHCFRDFPLSDIVNHSNSCREDMLGPRERFKDFLPSVHDMDPMALSVLTENQLQAVQYVMGRSKLDSESIYSELLSRVISLGYSERDLEIVLNWVRRDAPIIVHVSLDHVLGFLVKDTHYRNLFEVGTGSGSKDFHARSAWEDRIFNCLYASSRPVDRVKYGVLNIVGDPRGVQSCYGYGDSFLQLKKVRLRTTFASDDTSHAGVQLSCCEHYGNVLNEYSRRELQAILDVATRKKPFLQSNVISHYKEVQIHGPLCLSENVDCIVVNERHAGDRTITNLLDQFVKRNKCNLLWMDPIGSVNYPSPSPSKPTRHRRRRKKKRRRHDSYTFYDDTYAHEDDYCEDNSYFSEEDAYFYEGDY